MRTKEFVTIKEKFFTVLALREPEFFSTFRLLRPVVAGFPLAPVATAGWPWPGRRR